MSQTWFWNKGKDDTKGSVYKGRLNETKYTDFVRICKMAQGELKAEVSSRLKDWFPDVVCSDGFVYAKGTMPVLLTAHLDTVHKEPVRDFYEYTDENGNDILSSPQGIGGDDRCGVYMILRLLEETDFRPSILFCEDEEIGGIGSNKFCVSTYINDLKGMRFLIELDRMGSSDAVYYDDDNAEFHEWIYKVTGCIENYGSFSDISHLSPACMISSVNLSCGYYHAHTLKEEVNVNEMLGRVEAVKKLLKASEDLEAGFEYKEKVYYNNYYGRYYDNGADYYYSPTRVAGHRNTQDKSATLFVEWWDARERTSKNNYIEGVDENDCWVDFFFNNPNVCFNDVLDYEYTN